MATCGRACTMFRWMAAFFRAFAMCSWLEVLIQHPLTPSVRTDLPPMVSLLYFCIGDCIPARDTWLGCTFWDIMSIIACETRDRPIARPRWSTALNRLQDRTRWAHFGLVFVCIRGSCPRIHTRGTWTRTEDKPVTFGESVVFYEGFGRWAGVGSSGRG